MIRKRFKIFYGWYIVVACSLVAMYVSGTVVYGFTAVFEPIALEFGWSYTQISLAASLRGIEIGLLAPLLGRLTDRWGPRRLVFGGIIIICLGLILLSRINSLAMFYIAFAALAVGTSACTSTVLFSAVANWFQRKIGLATGIVSSGFGASGVMLFVIVRLIDAYDWRTALLIISLGILVIGSPLTLLIRHKPEKYGYLPDGDKSVPPTSQDTDVVQSGEHYTTAKQAMKSRVLWHIALAASIQSMALIAVITHVMPYLSSLNIPRSTAAVVAAFLPLLSITGRLGFGWLGDRFDKRRVAALAFLMMSLGLLCFSYIDRMGIWLVIPFVVLFAPGFGAIACLRAAMLRESFGRVEFGAIHGLAVAIMLPASITGAPLVGWVFDNLGTYQLIWLVFAGLMIVGMSLVLTIKTKKH